jgi:hypothetical protein
MFLEQAFGLGEGPHAAKQAYLVATGGALAHASDRPADVVGRGREELDGSPRRSASSRSEIQMRGGRLAACQIQLQPAARGSPISEALCG